MLLLCPHHQFRHASKGADSMEIIYFPTSAEFHDWLVGHHDQATEVWIGFYKKDSGLTGITYAEALDEALCFGWIDTVVKSVDEKRFARRWTPRKKNSIWSQVNINRVAELTDLGRMQPAGLKTFAERNPAREKLYSHEKEPQEFDRNYEAEFRAHGSAWDFFCAQAPTYQRVVKHWVMGAKREETRLKRLNEAIEASARGERLRQFVSPPGKGKQSQA
jgi:uncharacterized protein YdeI (YjbR/CyaY-like superfamily)